MVMPDRILVPPALETTADNLFQGANLVVGALGSTSAKSDEPNLNAHRKGKYRRSSRRSSAPAARSPRAATPGGTCCTNPPAAWRSCRSATCAASARR
jgi:hypothetical protein